MPLIKEAYVKYRWNIEEFFLFGYEQLTDEQRKEFCPEYDHNAFCLKVNNWATARIFRDKRATYLKFKDFFNRSCVYVSNSSEYNSDECQEFIKNNPVFLLKPIGTCCGRGIQKLTNNAPNLQETILSVAVMGGVILEELIEQVPEMAVLHPESVNTLRIPTINYGDHIEVFHPFMRMGMGKAFVDNAGAGGIGATIDPQTGKVMNVGDELGRSYTHHPDSGVDLTNFTVPRWVDAVETAKKLASMVPDVRYCGWDLALTKDGWVMIEGNEDGQFVFQYFDHKGCSKEIMKVLKDFN